MTTIWSETMIAELRAIVGDTRDEVLKQILALDPSWEGIEEAVAWADGRGDALPDHPSPVGKIGQIIDMLESDALEEVGPISRTMTI